MSCYWRVRCEDCNEEEDYSHNHGESILLAIVAARHLLMDLPGDIDFHGSYSVAAYFVQSHATHNLTVVSEYDQTIYPDPEYFI